MKALLRALGLTACLIGAAHAEPAKLQPDLAGLGFLVGSWATPQRNAVQDTGGAATGTSRITVEAGGAALLRRDHTDLYDAAGKPTGGFDIVMLIYAEGGALKADYADGRHVIHYTSAAVTPGRSVVFSSAAAPGAGTFRLGYALGAPDTVTVTFETAPPGGAFRPIASGSLARVAERP